MTIGVTIVIITHNIESAFHVADRIGILGKRGLIVFGTKDEVRANQDPEAQNFLRASMSRNK